MTVKPDQLYNRAQMIIARRHQLEELAKKQNGRLKRYERWQHEYAFFPYLLGAPDERLASRFIDIFINQTELNSDAKIGTLPVDEKNAFIAKFSHILEEYRLRTGNLPPQEVVDSALEPAQKYFDCGEPIAAKIFHGYTAPVTPFVVKYGDREHLERLYQLGELRICPASHYNKTSYNAAIKDDEIRRTFFIPTFRERLKGVHHIMYKGSRIEFEDDDIIIQVEADDYFMLSLCDSIYYRMPTDFGANAALIIHDPDKFAQRVISSFLARYPDWKPHYGPVTYYDPYRDHNKLQVHQMSKHFGYAYQREVRVVMEPYRAPRHTLQPEFLNIGAMDDYAEFLWA